MGVCVWLAGCFLPSAAEGRGVCLTAGGDLGPLFQRCVLLQIKLLSVVQIRTGPGVFGGGKHC